MAPLILLLLALIHIADATDVRFSSDNLEDTGSSPINDPNEGPSDAPGAHTTDPYRIDKLFFPVQRYCSHDDFARYEASGQETTLRQVLLVHRHGDRTPVRFRQGDPLADEQFWKFHGYGQLTNRGKERMYVLGKVMRQRYHKFIRGSVNRNMRLSRSSGATRCIESAQVFLAAFLSLDAPNSPDVEGYIWNSDCTKLGYLWQPASVQSMATSMDGMLAEGAQCDALDDELDNTIEPTPLAQWIHQEFQKEVAPLEEVLGYKMDRFYKWSWASGHMEVERSYFEDKLDPRILAVYDRAQEAGRFALLAEYSTPKSRRLRSGLLVNDIIGHMKKSRQQILTGEEPKKLIHYSTHDVNIFSLLAILGNSERFPFSPSFAASIILELHQDEDEWFVKLFYMPHVPSKLFELHVGACEKDHPRSRCTLDKLEEVVQPYSIDKWSSWMKECKNDITKLNPY